MICPAAFRLDDFEINCRLVGLAESPANGSPDLHSMKLTTERRRSRRRFCANRR